MTAAIMTGRLTLRPLEPSDLARLVPLANNWAVASKLGRMPFPYGPAEGAAFLAHVAATAQERVYAIARPEGLIGCIGLHPIEVGPIELGYWLGEPYWGQGYATEAGRAVLAVAFAVPETAALVAGHFLDNPASGRVLEKLGFRYSGESLRDCLAQGHKVASREMRLSRGDWNPS
jgi:RimJ/RimL family protein N-acetyltransferase